MVDSPLPPLRRQNAARPCDFALLPDDCVNHLLKLVDAEAVPCSRAVCRAFRAAARARAGERVPTERIIRSGPSVAAWAWAQPAFRAVAGSGMALLCAELGHLDLLERVLAHRNDNLTYERDLWIGAGEAGHAHILQWLLDRAARLSRGCATRLDLKNCEMEDEDMLHLASALRADTTLISLDLSFHYFGDRGVNHLTCALAANGTLTTLNMLSNCWLTERGARALVAVAESKPNQIRSLCGIAADATYADLSDRGLDAADAVLLAFELRVNATLTKLDLGCNKIGDVGAQHIAEALKVNATLTNLDLLYNGIGVVGMQHIAAAIKVNSTVTQLDIRNNDLADSSEILHWAPARSTPAIAATATEMGAAVSWATTTMTPARRDYARSPRLCPLAGFGSRIHLLADADLPCFRLACKAFRDHSSPAQERCRTAFLRTHALVVFAWMEISGFVLYLTTMLCLAAYVGCVEVIEELVDNRHCALAESACEAAAEKGQMGALGWLRSRSCPWDISTSYRAAEGGYLEVLRYAHEHGCPWDLGTCYRAAFGGHVEVLRYAHEHGCPWDSYTCSCAAQGGHLEVLRYAHEHSCPWDWVICYRAVQEGHLEMLRYALEHGCQVSMHIAEALKVNATVTQLYLGGNQIGDVGAQHLAEALKVNTTVTELDLRCNEIGDTAADSAAEETKMAVVLYFGRGRMDEGDSGTGTTAAAKRSWQGREHVR
ncbi:hypothetical protein T492DRAFT_859893 [Pavlovales sp. CCMP2436]|nr:hypothetical protein T492DRAFT_859893 [Pavlovales sp. CCMP2436]